VKYIGLLAAIILAGCSTTNPQAGKIIVQPDTVYLKPEGWVISYSEGVHNRGSTLEATHPDALGNAWAFDFPDSNGHVNYVMVPYGANKSHKNIIVTFKVVPISGLPKFVSLDKGCGGVPASFRVMLERRGDTLSSSQEFHRWWSNPYNFVLVADSKVHTLTCPLDPEHWSSVFGKFGNQAQSEFDATLKNLAGVGITFGGGCSFGHGVYAVNGKAQFQLIDFQVL
jgi:hypothetical protein